MDSNLSGVFILKGEEWHEISPVKVLGNINAERTFTIISSAKIKTEFAQVRTFVETLY